MIRKVTLLLALAFGSYHTYAQQTEKAALETTAAPEITSDSTRAIVKPQATFETKSFVKKPSFNLAAGSMVSKYGMATYLSPSMHYQLSPKFSVFGGITYLNSSFTPHYSENKTPMASKNYFAYAGGSYDVSDKLRLSGSVWRDFAGASSRLQPNGYSQPNRYGTSFSAQYKFSEHFSITGGIRTSNGYSPNAFYNPGYGDFGF